MKIEIPSTCPVCDGEVKRVKDQLFCKNPSCSAKTLKNLSHFVKTMKIKGLGEKTLEKLKIDNVSALYNFTEEELKTILGTKIGIKIYNEIQKSLNTTLSRLIAALGISLIGNSAGEKLQNTVSSISEINAETCKKAGLGAKATTNLISWLDTNWYQYAGINFNIEDSEPVESGLAVCVSGKVPGYTKAKIKELLLDYNVTVKDNVTKDLDYLITNESGTTKAKKAEQYNINIISFELFMENLKNE